jgi:hypothetical protein
MQLRFSESSHFLESSGPSGYPLQRGPATEYPHVGRQMTECGTNSPECGRHDFFLPTQSVRQVVRTCERRKLEAARRSGRFDERYVWTKASQVCVSQIRYFRFLALYQPLRTHERRHMRATDLARSRTGGVKHDSNPCCSIEQRCEQRFVPCSPVAANRGPFVMHSHKCGCEHGHATRCSLMQCTACWTCANMSRDQRESKFKHQRLCMEKFADRKPGLRPV